MSDRCLCLRLISSLQCEYGIYILDRVLVDWSSGGCDCALTSLQVFLFLLVLEVRINFDLLFVALAFCEKGLGASARFGG